MDRSRFIAGLIGPTLVAVAVSQMIDQGLVARMAAGLATDPTLIVFSGIITLVAGLAIVMSHNIWRGWPVIVTVFGWLAIVSGLVRIILPMQIARLAPALTANDIGVGFVVGFILILGLFLSWKAFRA